MSQLYVENNAESFVTDDPLDSGATSVTVESGDGSLFPSSTPFRATIWDSATYSMPSDDPDMEIVEVTDVSSDTFTITRGMEGTSDVQHPNGSTIANYVTRGLFQDSTYGIQDRIEQNATDLSNHSSTTDAHHSKTQVEGTPTSGNTSIAISSDWANSHEGTSDIHHSRYTDEEVRDTVAAFIVGGTAVTVTHDDADDTFTIDSSDTQNPIDSNPTNGNTNHSVSSDYLYTHVNDSDAHHNRPSAGDGLTDDSDTFNINVSDFAGSGLQDDGSDNLQLTNDSVTVAGNSVALGNSTDVSHADLINVDGNGNHLTADQNDAVDGANSPSSSNVFATMDDLSSGGGGSPSTQFHLSAPPSTVGDTGTITLKKWVAPSAQDITANHGGISVLSDGTCPSGLEIRVNNITQGTTSTLINSNYYSDSTGTTVSIASGDEVNIEVYNGTGATDDIVGDIGGEIV